MLKKRLFVTGGTLALGLGVAGMFLPVLPTTPFLLLAGYCYLRGSGRLYRWLMNHRILGNYIQNYLQYRAISKPAKTVSLMALWLSLSISFAVAGGAVVRIILILVGIGVTVHLLSLNTLPKQSPAGNTVRRRKLPAENR